MEGESVDKVLELIRRSVDAQEVTLSAHELGEDETTSLACQVRAGLWVVARFEGDLTTARVELQGKLAHHVECFAASLAHSGVAPVDGESTPELDEVLRALADEAGATDAFVVDVKSPIVWGSARKAGGECSPEEPPHRGHLTLLQGGLEEELLEQSGDEANLLDQTCRAARHLRRAPSWGALASRGAKLREEGQGHGFGYLARSFAQVYVVVVVFDGPFDELVAAREVTRMLPRIEQVVLSLPPIDPGPGPRKAAAALKPIG